MFLKGKCYRWRTEIFKVDYTEKMEVNLKLEACIPSLAFGFNGLNAMHCSYSHCIAYYLLIVMVVFWGYFCYVFSPLCTSYVGTQ